MDATMQKMEAQLKRWNARIDNLATRTQLAGVGAGFDALLYIDELKALHAIAQAKFDAFGAAKDAVRPRLQIELDQAWRELECAFRDPRPPA